MSAKIQVPKPEEVLSAAHELVDEAHSILAEVTERCDPGGVLAEFGQNQVEILLELSQQVERAARLLKISAIMESLSFVGMVACPQCGEEFHAGSHKSTRRKDW